MKEDSGNLKSLLFLCLDEYDGHFADLVFNEECKKMDVVWTSAAKRFEDANAGDLAVCSLVVVLRKSGTSMDMKSRFPSYSGKYEVWNIPEATGQDEIRTNIGRLLVSLILQGGKRQPAAGSNVQVKGTEQSTGADSKSKDAVRVSRETKGRGGKTVTVISGLSAGDAEMQKLATRLKQLCGTGGTIKDGKIEIQGDQCDRILTELQSRGYKAKRSGG